MVESASDRGATVRIQNTYDFPVRVVNVRFEYPNPDGSRKLIYSAPGVDEMIEPESSWTGMVHFDNPDGADLASPASTSVAAGVHIAEELAAADAALAAGDIATIRAQLPLVRARVVPVSRAVRFHSDALQASGVDVSAWFDLERLDATVTALEDALCEDASTRLLRAGGQAARQRLYEEIAPQLREDGLHINCINGEAKLAAARMLIASNRPQDALVFRETDSEGNVLPDWVPILVDANLALANAAAQYDAIVLSTIRPAVDALNEVHRLAPDHPDLQAVAARVVPLATRFVREACDPNTMDIDNARLIVEKLRPTWDHIPGVMEAAGDLADALLRSGLRYCERREFVNARNRFVRGDRLLEGVPQWDENRDRINHCRAMGALEEGREIADHPTDPRAAERGYEKLDEALSRFALTDDEINDFKAHIAGAWIRIAEMHIEEMRLPLADHALRQAETIHPEGRTDDARRAWISYAEKRHERGGFFMNGAAVQDARRALELAENVDEARIDAISLKLTTVYYGYRVGIPALAMLVLLFGALYTWRLRRRARNLALMAEGDMY